MNVSSASHASSFLIYPQQGIERAFAKANAAGQRIAEGDLDPEAFIDLTESEMLVKANAAVMRTGDAMLGTLLNIRA